MILFCDAAKAVSRPKTIGLFLISIILFLTSCETTAMTHAQWKAEQAKKEAAEKAGVEYKSPSQIKKEVEETRKVVKDVRFEGERK